MPDLSPAGELRAAAARLRERADALPFVATLKPAVGAYLAAMRPDVARAVAEWLDAEAGHYEVYESADIGPPLKAARAILAGDRP